MTRMFSEYVVSGNGTAGDTRRLVPALALAIRHRR